MVTFAHPQNSEINDFPLFLDANLHTTALTLCCAKRRDSSKCWWTACAARCFSIRSWSCLSCSILSCLSLSIFSLSCLSCLSRSNFSRAWRSRSARSRSFSRSLCCFSSSRASWFCRSLHKNATTIITGAYYKTVHKERNILHLCEVHCRSTTQIFSQQLLATIEGLQCSHKLQTLKLVYWFNDTHVWQWFRIVFIAYIYYFFDWHNTQHHTMFRKQPVSVFNLVWGLVLIYLKTIKKVVSRTLVWCCVL